MNGNPSNIPKEIAESPSANLKVDPTDPTTAKLVKDFLAEKQAAESGQEPQLSVDENAPVKPAQVNIPPGDEFAGGDPTQQAVNNTFSPVVVECTDLEKELFLKAVLSDEPVRLPITLYQGKFNVEIRSRSTYEQRRVFDAINQDKKEGKFAAEDLAMAVTRFHYYLASLMVEKINGETFSELRLPPNGNMADDVQKLREVADAKMESMHGVRWNSLLTALNIFENKCAKLNSEAANEGFWSPHGSA